MFLVLTVLVAAPGTAEAVDAAYVDVTSAVGISFTHSPGDLCVPPIGAGSAWADADGDGDVDLFITQRDNTLPNKLYQNVGDTVGTPDGLPDFVDIAAAAGVADTASYGLSAVFIDYDNDGDQDLYVTNHPGEGVSGGNNKLFENTGNNGDSIPDFVDVTATAGLADGGRAITSGWADFNNDGFLDVYLAKHRKCGTANVDSQDHLYMSNGDGTFSDVTGLLCPGGVAPCSDVLGLGFSPGWFDYDNDGDQDLYVANDNIGGSNQNNKLWRNDGSDGVGGWIFTYVGATSGSDTQANAMGLGIGDYDNDGDFDMAFSDVGPANLLNNNGDGTFSDVSLLNNFDTMTDSVTWATAFLDADNDADLDMFLAAGQIGTVGLPNIYLTNNGDGTFTDTSAASGLDDGDSGLAASMVDFDNDGFVDLLINNYSGPTVFMRNNGTAAGNTNNWLTVTVEGTESNRDGIGTRIEYATTGGTQIREISTGATHGGGDFRAAYFGAGADTTGTLTVKWPNGQTEVISSVATGQAIHLVEPATGPVFSEVSAAVGINFTHSIGAACAPPIGSGSAWADADGDGDADLFITQRDDTMPNHFYLNMGDTSGDGLPDFVEVAAAAGVDHPTGVGLGSVFVDIDNDGDQDLFVSNLDDNKLYRNDGDIIGADGVPDFTDISAAAGIVDFGRAITPSFGDYDNDGFLDIYLPKHIRCAGEGSEDAEDRLLHNNGDNTFTDVTGYLCGGLSSCADTEGLGFSAGWFDYDNDG
ncbi:MAG: VCBS repeat-containing protein, partial [Acidimicrobiia bacterium]|nr:VCBS repeat-containing protein [Acidimicrobiia bacterium]